MKLKLYTIILLYVLFSACETKQQDDLIFHNSTLERKKNAPFSDAVTAGKTLYLSGQVGIHPETNKLVAGGITMETIQTLENIKNVLKLHGSDLEHVVKCTVILANLEDFNEFNTIFRKYFPKNKPARTTFAADLLVNAKIEMDVIAVKVDGFKDARVSK